MMLSKSWIANLPLNIITDVARDHDIPWTLLAAIVQTESGGNPMAARFESHYKYTVTPAVFAKENGISEITELVLQKTSIGLTQVMGGVARELGHRTSLLELTDPELGLKYGCLQLRRIAKRWNKQPDMIAAYNAGSPIMGIDGKYKNQGYVDKVLGLFHTLNETFDYKI